ncbi:MAG TPA: aldo/keto reductase [Bacteroidia bacterium]|jgi:predicted oxidoreductase|nr:aldo/keto reductase [Bacteroidia bacterium]
MEKIYISDSGPEVSAAIYSFWRWDTPALVSEKKVEDIINYNLELGVNTFDHSDEYGNGKIQELFGKAVFSKSFKREDIVISTKAGLRKDAKGKAYYDHSAQHIKNSVGSSLKKLKTDYIDIFLLEGNDPLLQVDETASLLSELVNSGHIRAIGVSNFSASQHRLLAAHLSQPIITNHIELSILQTTSITDGRLDFIKEQYSKPMAWAPLAGGRILTGKDKKAEKVRKVLQATGKKYGVNVEEIAVAWLYKLGALPLIGSADKKRIKNAASAYAVELSREDWYSIYNATF